MIHFALGVAAFLFIGWLVLQAIRLVASGFEEGPGCGCLALIGVALVAILLLALFA
jgi:hypothetical protein